MNKRHLISAAVAAALCSTSAFATNGMILEGYGARATAMGGAAMAYDSGNSGALNNPATLSLMDANVRAGAGIRYLGPDITSSFGPASTDSEGTAYWMPSASYIRKAGDWTYGVAMLAQGGMGTEYGQAGPTDLFAGNMSLFNNPVPLSGQEIRSEVGVGTIMFPLSKQVNDRLTIGGSIDFVWAMMDLQMDMSGAQFGQLMQGNGGRIDNDMGMGVMLDTAGGTLAPDGIPSIDMNWARFDFTDDNDMTGEAKTTGWMGQLGFTYALSDRLRIGGSYRSKTHLDDMDTNDATLSMLIPAMGATPMALTGTLNVVDFQWPDSIGLGLSFQATDRVMVVADYKRIGWKDVMQSFRMTFTPDAGQMGGMFDNTMLDVTMDQNWEDQNVFSLGFEYQASEKLALRAGVNLADNPVPNSMVNPLFPATIEDHITGGFGYKLTKNDNLGFSFTFAPEVETVGTGPLNSMPGMGGVVTTHSQFNWSLSYSRTW
jgi:long-chain fatty acid transport protein